jgi:hypothetical protein
MRLLLTMANEALSRHKGKTLRTATLNLSEEEVERAIRDPRGFPIISIGGSTDTLQNSWDTLSPFGW